MNVKKSLELHIRGWFPQEPVLKKTLQVQGITKSINPKSAFWDNVSWFASGVVILEILVLQLIQHSDLAWNFQITLIFISVWTGLTVFLLRRKQGLNDWPSSILFINAIAIVASTGALFWFAIINFTGYVITSIVIVSAFSLLYAWNEKLKTDFPLKRGKNKHKFVSTIFVLTGIILLMFSLALSSHIESRLTSVGHDETLLNQTFNLTQQIPNNTVSVNLTTQYRLDFFILPASIVPHSSNYSSIDFSISYQPPLGQPPVEVYERNNISSYTHDPTGSWPVPQNGTYNLNFHYNYSEKANVEEIVGKHWLTIEPVPTKVYTPYLASYTAPTLIIASAFLIGGTVIPIQQVLKIKSFNNKQSSEFTNSRQS
jgi:hypothetical protein